eukprot:SAG31_NODE_31256_length_370_cov_0.763838_1_plen_45_part_01
MRRYRRTTRFRGGGREPHANFPAKASSIVHKTTRLISRLESIWRT